MESRLKPEEWERECIEREVTSENRKANVIFICFQMKTKTHIQVCNSGKKPSVSFKKADKHLNERSHGYTLRLRRKTHETEEREYKVEEDRQGFKLQIKTEKQ